MPQTYVAFLMSGFAASSRSAVCVLLIPCRLGTSPRPWDPIPTGSAGHGGTGASPGEAEAGGWRAADGGGHLCHWCGTVGPVPAPWGALHCWVCSLQRFLRGCGGCLCYGTACRSFTHPLCLSACCCPGSRVSWVERGSRFLLRARGGGLVSMGAVLQRGLPPVPPGWQPGLCSLSWQSQPG